MTEQLTFVEQAAIAALAALIARDPGDYLAGSTLAPKAWELAQALDNFRPLSARPELLREPTK